MRVSELRGLPVIDPKTARRIGIVQDVLLDPRAARIAALDVQGPDEAETQRIVADCVRRVGQSAVMLRGSLQPSDTSPCTPVDDLLDLEVLAGLEVMGEDGNRMGNLVDAYFNPDGLHVECWELAVPLMEKWLGSGGRIQPSAVTACSREMMLVKPPRHGLETASPTESQVTSDGRVESRPLVGSPHNGSHDDARG